MRIAYVAQSVPVTADVDPSPFAAENLMEMATQHDLVVFVDENTRGTELLSRSGIDVSISPKRPLDVDGRIRESDALVAAELSKRHGEERFDEIWYSSEYLSDLSWHEPSLCSARQMVVLGSHAIRLTRLIWSHPESIRSFGIESWATVGRLVRADGIITDVSPFAYGLRADLLPDTRPTGIPLPSTEPLPQSPGLAVIVTTWGDRRDMSRSITEALDLVGVSERTTLAILHDDAEVGGMTAGRAIWQSIPEGMRRSTVMVPIRADGVASAFLDSADVIVCATTAESTFPAVRTAMRTTPFAILDDERRSDRPLGDASGNSIDPVVVLEIGPSESMTEALSTVPHGSGVVIHTSGHGDVAERIATAGRLEAVDVTLVCEPDGIYGSVSRRLCGDVVGIAPHLRPGFDEVLGDRTLGEAIRSLLNPANVGRVSLQLLPLGGVDVFDAEWCLDEDSVLPVSRGLIEVAPIVVAAGAPVPTAPPAHPAPREWVENLAWKDRLRLLLPWKWGLLGRAMRGRW